jgi:diguanylate cyclase (GGDEF)-like protein
MQTSDARLRILAIDDTPANLQVLAAALVTDFRFQIATSGAIGLAAASRTPPDLILLDVMMPDMDGFEVFRRLKADPALQAIPVMFLTAMSSMEAEAAGLAMGAADYISKPIKVETAKLRIRNLIEREGLRKDVAEKKTQLERLAHYDPLTGLPNRALLADRMSQAMMQSQRRGQRLAMAFLDLDGFKAINDTHGHAAGDQLLVTLAQRMKEALREGDTLARLGGDEFVAVLLDLDELDDTTLILNRLLTAAAQPVLYGETMLQVSASLGVSFYPQAQMMDADQLMRQADQAMYQAKQAGKNCFRIFDSEQDRSLRERHESMQSIRQAMAANEFVLQYQPKVNLRSGAVIGVEAFIRWIHPERGMLPPAQFLPMVEDHPLAVELGQWVIACAVAQIERWQQSGLNLPVSVNIGARHLHRADFVRCLREQLAKHSQVKPAGLALELLETSAFENLDHVCEVIAACQEIGIQCALDDFGTGYASLTYLKKLPVAQLKIGQSFVRGMLDDPKDRAILKSIIELAAVFELQVIAKGVETVGHGVKLLQLGCELGQGYAIAHPMLAAELPDWIANWRPDPAWRDVQPAA